jgi:flagellar capping protein FliD
MMSISTDYTGQLDTQYLTMINSLMEIERQPLVKLQEARENLTVRKAIYTDLQGLLTTLQSSTKALISTDASYTFSSGRKVTTLAANGATVLTASASTSATAASYTVNVTTLAKAHRALSDKQTSMSAALNQAGNFLVGGAGTVAGTTDNTVTAFSAASNVTSGQNELSSGDYYVETQEVSPDTWQFRLVDASGSAVSIRDAAAPSSFTDAWQAIPTGGGAYDTGRGLALTLGGDSYIATSKDSGAAKVTYTGGRTSVAVLSTDSLANIASKINNSTFASGKEVTATVIDARLVLTAKNTGTDYAISASDSSGSVLQNLGVLQSSGAFKNASAASNATFTVNSLPVMRSSNTGLTDVINGVTINFASDAEGKEATLDVLSDSADETKKLNSFISAFNGLTSQLSVKLATVKQADGTYTRGALAGDNSLYSLRLDLLRQINTDASNSGTLKNLSQIGISLDSSMKLQISDASKLSEALTNNKANVTKLMDAMMDAVNTKVGRFNGTTGYVTSLQKTIDSQIKTSNSTIDQMNARLVIKKASLYEQFATAQDQITQMLYTQQRMAALFGGSYS